MVEITDPQTEHAIEATSCKRLLAYVVSDVHLNNHPYDRDRFVENPRRQNFRKFLTEINESLTPTDRLLLVLNGDILDVTGSWNADVMPWDSHPAAVNEALAAVLLEILNNNLAACDELRKMLKHPGTEIVYVFGNHDGLLQQAPQSQEIIKNFLSAHPQEQARFRFAESYQDETLNLYIAHGHLLDPFNRRDGKQPPLGDVVNILVVNRFVGLAVERFRVNGYPEGFIEDIHHRLHDIEYLRPLALVPVWLQNLSHRYQKHPESKSHHKSVHDILIEVISEILQEPKMTAYFRRYLYLSKTSLDFLIKTILRLPAILPVVSFITVKLVRRTHSNKYQYKKAQKLNQQNGYRLITFGHTHIPGVMPLSRNAYYFNTGSWKPVINLFKNPRDPVELQDLHPDVQLNKVERCGILRIEKLNPDTDDTPAEFSLQTIQSGLS